MKTIFLICIISLMLFSNCNEAASGNKTIVKKTKFFSKKQSTTVSIDLDSFPSIKIQNLKTKEHKTLEKKDEIDSAIIISGLVSILSSDYEIKPKNDYEGDVILSNLKIFNRRSLIFSMDSVLAVTPFEVDKSQRFFSYSIIYQQNQDNFSTTADLFLVDLSNNNVSLIKRKLTSTVNAPFSKDNTVIYYLNNSILYTYDYFKKNSTPLIKFDNPSYVILNIQYVSPVVFKVIYMKDVSVGELFSTNISIR